MSFTRHVGEVGVEGSRTVRPGGKVIFNTLFIQSERLLPFVGKEVFCWYNDVDVNIHTAVYRPYLTTMKPPRPSIGDWITTIYKRDIVFRSSPNKSVQQTRGKPGC